MHVKEKIMITETLVLYEQMYGDVLVCRMDGQFAQEYIHKYRHTVKKTKKTETITRCAPLNVCIY